MIYINITMSVLIHNMIETRHLKTAVIFIQTTLSFVLSRKIITIIYLFLFCKSHIRCYCFKHSHQRLKES